MPAVICIGCKCADHVYCLSKQHKDSADTENKNSIDWLNDFINTYFVYQCSAWKSKLNDAAMLLNDLHQHAEDECALKEMKKSLHPLANSTLLGHSAAANGDGVDGSSNGFHSACMQRQLPSSYTKVVSNDLADAVK